MDHIDCLVQIIGDKDTNQEHVHIDECCHKLRPLLTVEENAIVPIEREEDLKDCQTLYHPCDHLLKHCRLVILEILVELVHD